MVLGRSRRLIELWSETEVVQWFQEEQILALREADYLLLEQVPVRAG